MLKKLSPLTLILVLLAGPTACKSQKKGAPKAGELSEAKKAELRARAVKEYQKLVERYPDSARAAEAQARIQALTPPKK